MAVVTTAAPGYDDLSAPSDLRERDDFTGRVSMFDVQRSFGFITPWFSDGGGDVFLHKKEVRSGRPPQVGDILEFNVRSRGDGLRAVDVTAVGVRANRALAGYADAARAKSLKRGAAGLQDAFASGSSGGAAVETALALPAGLTSAAELRRRQEAADEAVAQAVTADAEAQARRSDDDNRTAAAAMRRRPCEPSALSAPQGDRAEAMCAGSQGGPVTDPSVAAGAEVGAKPKKKRTRAKPVLSFDVDEDF